jgi:hypothetical protein
VGPTSRQESTIHSRRALAVAGGIMPSEPPLPTPVTDLLEDSEMSKKKRADIGKLVDAQAKGKKVTGSKTDKETPEGGALDVRTSKWIKTDFG